MRVSAKTDYAVRALAEIARAGERSVNAAEIATTQEIPHGFLLTILSDLRRAGLLRSLRGKGGG